MASTLSFRKQHLLAFPNLRQERNATQIDISGNRIHDFHGMPHCPKLKVLEANNTAIVSFKDAQQQPALEQLFLFDCPLGDEAFLVSMALIAIGPSLQVVNTTTVNDAHHELAARLRPLVERRLRKGWVVRYGKQDGTLVLVNPTTRNPEHIFGADLEGCSLPSAHSAPPSLSPAPRLHIGARHELQPSRSQIHISLANASRRRSETGAEGYVELQTSDSFELDQGKMPAPGIDRMLKNGWRQVIAGSHWAAKLALEALPHSPTDCSALADPHVGSLSVAYQRHLRAGLNSDVPQDEYSAESTSDFRLGEATDESTIQVHPSRPADQSQGAAPATHGQRTPASARRLDSVFSFGEEEAALRSGGSTIQPSSLPDETSESALAAAFEEVESGARCAGAIAADRCSAKDCPDLQFIRAMVVCQVSKQFGLKYEWDFFLSLIRGKRVGNKFFEWCRVGIDSFRSSWNSFVGKWDSAPKTAREAAKEATLIFGLEVAHWVHRLCAESEESISEDQFQIGFQTLLAKGLRKEA
jgi:hypothetical protein